MEVELKSQKGVRPEHGGWPVAGALLPEKGLKRLLRTIERRGTKRREAGEET